MQAHFLPAYMSVPYNNGTYVSHQTLLTALWYVYTITIGVDITPLVGNIKCGGETQTPAPDVADGKYGGGQSCHKGRGMCYMWYQHIVYYQG